MIVEEGGPVQGSTGWKRVWTDGGSGNEQDYSVWMGTHYDKAFRALGVFCKLGTEGVSPPDWRCAMVHKSCCEAVEELGDVAWTDGGTGANADLTLNQVGNLNMMWPSVASAMEGGSIPDPVQINPERVDS